MQHELVLQQQEVDSGRIEASRTLTAMTIKLAEMRSRLIRLDALGERLTQIARLEDGEFNFADTPGVGGPEGSPLQRSISSLNVQPELTAIFDKLDRKLDNRESPAANTHLNDVRQPSQERADRCWHADH